MSLHSFNGVDHDSAAARVADCGLCIEEARVEKLPPCGLCGVKGCAAHAERKAASTFFPSTSAEVDELLTSAGIPSFGSGYEADMEVRRKVAEVIWRLELEIARLGGDVSAVLNPGEAWDRAVAQAAEEQKAKG